MAECKSHLTMPTLWGWIRHKFHFLNMVSESFKSPS